MSRPTPADLLIIGGHVALDFANTVGGPRDSGPALEFDALASYDDVVAWSLRVGTLSPRQASALRSAASGDDAAAEAAFEHALSIRALTYEVFRALAEERKPPDSSLERLRDLEREALSHARLKPDGRALRWIWPASPDGLEAPLWPVVHAAVDLLTHGPLERLKLCANCCWMFLDESRNRSRRWCSMEDCGTAVKKERFIERRRERRAR